VRLPDPVDPAIARRRAAELRAVGERKAMAHRESRVGGDADVVVVGGASAPMGLTEDYLDVAVRSRSTARGARFRAKLERDDDRLVARADGLSPRTSSLG
jgi:tRNA A37 methylthiotransferase MiaB